MNELKPEDVMRELEAWIYDFKGTATQFCALCDALTLLREKDAEIERLKKASKNLSELENGWIVTGYKNIRAEAITEFADRLKSKCDAPNWCVWLSEIEDLEKEMKGATDGKSDL